MATQFLNTDLADAIELRKVNQSYDGGKTYVIQDLSFLVEHKKDEAGFVVILGASGCGKSTLLRYVAGLQIPTLGDVLINGHFRTDQDIVSMVFQQYSSLPFKTVLENVMLPLVFKGVSNKDAKGQAMAMIKKVGLEGHEWKYAKYPLLSGGQLQRVAIARSLISNPKIILMDEPFGALDLHTRFKMQLMVADIWENMKTTIIFVTHDIQEAVFLANDIYIMRASPGQIVNHIRVDLPFHRDRSTKRESKFIELVNKVEDALLAVSS